MYRVFEGESEDGAIRYEGQMLPSDTAVGPGFVQEGLDAHFSGFGPSFVAHFNRWIPNANVRRGIIWVLRVLVVISVVVGATSASGAAWALGDIGVGATAWLNIIGIIILQGPALKAMKDYYEQKKAGKDPQFDPEALGIKNATFWEKRKLQNPELYGNAPVSRPAETAPVQE